MILRTLSKFHGKKGAMALFGLSIVFSFFTAYHFDLIGEDLIDIFHPVYHTKDLLARKLAAATKRESYNLQSPEWENSREDQDDYRKCTLNQPIERPNHGCVTDPDSKIPYCQVRNLRIVTSKISAPMGGEPLDSVMGRNEDFEIPKYLQGAFSTSEKLTLGENMNRDYWFYLLDVFMAMDVDKRQKCETTLTGNSLIITRYEYVDMYHTLKDLWNAFMVMPRGLEKYDRVIFLDSHAQGYLDLIWADLFGPTIHVKQIEEGTCLEQAIFVPSGYSSVLWPLGRTYTGYRCPAMAKAFVDFVIKSYSLENIELQKSTVLIIDQVKHIDHPRSVPQQEHSEDDSELRDLHTKLLDDTDVINVQIVDLHKLTFKSQLKLIRQAQIMLGFQKRGNQDGSQLALAMFLNDRATLVEIKLMGNDMQNIVRWRPSVGYHSVHAVDAFKYEILPNIKDILTPGWDAAVTRYPKEYYRDVEGDYNETYGDDRFGQEEEYQEDHLLTGWDSIPLDYDTADDYHDCALNSPQTRPSHGCVVNSDTKMTYCQLENLRIDSSLIESPPGGEYVDRVLGREESLEFPKYSSGALTVAKEFELPPDMDRSMFYYLNDVAKSISVSQGKPCVQTVTTPTLFITRYEYVSLYHTLCDFWNAFMVLPTRNDANFQVVFLDAHAEGFLDAVWMRAFGKYDYVKQLREGGVCFKQAIFIPSGYSSVLAPRERIFTSSPCPSMTKAFVEHMVQAYGLEKEVLDEGRITILDRVPFRSHPRRNVDAEKQAITNLEELRVKLKQSTNATSVEIVDLERTPFLEQLRVLRRSHIVLGTAEAGLPLMLFLQEGAHVFELGMSRIMQGVVKWRTGVTFRTLDPFGVVTSVIEEIEMEKTIVPAVNYALNKKGKIEWKAVPKKKDNLDTFNQAKFRIDEEEDKSAGQVDAAGVNIEDTTW